MKTIKMFILVLLSSFIFFSCKKFLDEKTRVTLAVPETLQDLQAILDSYSLINTFDASSGDVSAGDGYVTDADFLNRADYEQRLYTWQNSNVYASGDNDWTYAYLQIYRANTVIELTRDMEPAVSEQQTWNDVAGQGFFLRAKGHALMVGLHSEAWDPSRSGSLGIPLKLSTNFNEISTRNTLAETYDQIISDLKMAINLLPNLPLATSRSSKPAAYGLLARTYLFMRDYTNAYLYADSSLQLNSYLMDYNSLDSATAYPISQTNEEVMYSSTMRIYPIHNVTRSKVVPSLYSLYNNNDLRKALFFRRIVDGVYAFRGSYFGSSSYFCGIATDEMYLIKAETACRLGNNNLALSTLNALLQMRYRSGFFTAVNETNSERLLDIILDERRKELLFRGLTWSDIKRLNMEGRGINLNRTVNGTQYVLEANSPRFAIPIPEQVLVGGNIVQNIY